MSGLAEMLASYDASYIARCELRHLSASFFLFGLPLLASYRILTMRSLGRVTSTVPPWWWLGLLLALGLALGVTLDFEIDFGTTFPPGWA